jgi:hypothetical protein
MPTSERSIAYKLARSDRRRHQVTLKGKIYLSDQYSAANRLSFEP